MTARCRCRHCTGHQEAQREAQRRYLATPAGREAQRQAQWRYRRTPAGREAQRAAQARWRAKRRMQPEPPKVKDGFRLRERPNLLPEAA